MKAYCRSKLLQNAPIRALSLNAGQKYCRMLLLEYSAVLSTFIKLHVSFVIKIFVLFIFEWPFYTFFTTCICRISVKIIKDLCHLNQPNLLSIQPTKDNLKIQKVSKSINQIYPFNPLDLCSTCTGFYTNVITTIMPGACIKFWDVQHEHKLTKYNLQLMHTT